jgi:hypothetical protein
MLATMTKQASSPWARGMRRTELGPMPAALAMADAV